MQTVQHASLVCSIVPDHCLLSKHVLLPTHHCSPPAVYETGGIVEQSWEAQVLELDARLAASQARWKLVVGHHPVLSNHYPAPAQVTASLQPLLQR